MISFYDRAKYKCEEILTERPKAKSEKREQKKGGGEMTKRKPE